MVLNNQFCFTVIDNFLSDYECDYLIELAKNDLVRSKGGAIRSETKVVDARTSYQHWLKKDSNKIVYELGHRVAREVGIPFTHAEGFQVLRYELGQEYKPHTDAMVVDSEARKKSCAGWGQRLKTALLYLGDVEEGGETIFPNMGVTVPAKKGRMLVFKNIDEDVPDIPMYESLHGSLPVKAGVKWSCNIWFRQRDISLR